MFDQAEPMGQHKADADLIVGPTTDSNTLSDGLWLRDDAPGDERSAARYRRRPATASWIAARGFASRFGGVRRSIRLWFSEERAYGQLFLFLPLLVGIGALSWFQLERPPQFAVLAVLACVFGIAAWRLRHGAGTSALVMPAIAAVLFGMAAAAIETERAATILIDSPVATTVTGTVLSREVAGEGNWRYLVRVEASARPRLSRAPKQISLVVRGTGKPLAVGRRVRGRMRLSPPSGPALPGLNDFAFDSYFRNIGAVGYAFGALETLPPSQRAKGLTARGVELLAALREAVGARIRSSIGGDAGAIAAALITGEERAIDAASVEALRLSGLGHVLAISGMNMVLAAGTFLVGLRASLALVPGLAHRLAIKKLAAAGALLLVTLYLLLSGGAVSALRSYIMIVLMLVAVFFDRPAITLRNIALAALLILAVEPSSLAGPGFQMSFAATLALVSLYGRWRSLRAGAQTLAILPPVAQRSLRAFAGLIVTTAIGGASTMIYAAAHFNRLPAYGVLGNLLVELLIGLVIMPAALIAMLLMPLGIDQPALAVLGWGVEVMLVIARFVAGLGGQIITGEIPPAAFVLIALGGVVTCLLRTPLAVVGVLLIGVGLIVVVSTPLPHPAILIAEDGRLVALPGKTATATNRLHPPSFISDQWIRALRLMPYEPPMQRTDLAIPQTILPPRPQQGTGTAAPVRLREIRSFRDQLIAGARAGAFVCAPRQWCAARLADGRLIMTVEDVRLVGLACDVASLVVTPTSPRFRSCRSGSSLFSASTLRRSGAVMLFSDTAAPSGYRSQSAFTSLTRPWQRHRLYDWRSRSYEDVVLDEPNE